jgi:histidinol phosphatase-like PHP family hydrolase
MTKLSRRTFLKGIALGAVGAMAAIKQSGTAQTKPAEFGDWHIHSKYSPCGKPEATLEAVVAKGREAGLTAFGISDHLHSQLDYPQLRACREAYDNLPDRKNFYFGLEISSIRPWDLKRIDELGDKASIWGVQQGGPEEAPTLCLPDGFMDELKVDYTIGGTHWPLGVAKERMAIIKSYHGQNMFLATNSNIDIVAHPWWWLGEWKDADGRFTTLPWLDDFRVIPSSMHDEFACAAREHGTAIEISSGPVLLNPSYPDHFRGQYVEYLAFLKERNVTFSLASDSHGNQGGYANRLPQIFCDLDTLGIDRTKLWHPRMGKRAKK